MEKIALITGGAKRIGKEICLHLANQGWKIVIHYNKSEEEARELQAKINAISSSILIQQDFRSLENFDNFFYKIKQAIGTPTLLINNASSFVNDTIKSMKADSIQINYNVNCFAPLLLAQEFFKINNSAPDINIINILDNTLNTSSSKAFFSYSLSKSCLLQITKDLAVQFAPHCRVNAISLGFVIKSESQSEESFEKLTQSSLLKKRTEIGDIGKTINYILSLKSMTGNNLSI